MIRTLSQLPALWGIALFVIVPTILSAVIVVIVRRAEPISMLAENNEFIAIMYPVLGLFYGVFLAFAIVIVWQRFTDAENSVYREVASLAAMIRDAEALPAEDQARIRQETRAYVESIIRDEWPTMSGRGGGALTDARYRAVWKSFHAVTPHTAAESAFFTKALDELNNVSEAQRDRLLFSTSEMPSLLWTFLLFGAAVTIVFSYFIGTKHQITHAVTCAALTSIVGFSLLLIMELQYPFAGGVAIRDHAYRELLSLLAR